MFHFGGFPSLYYFIHIMILDSSSRWFPNSEICGSMLIYSSPQLIAVSHVLRRLPMPRHSPYALFRLNFLYRYSFLRNNSALFLSQIIFSVVYFFLLIFAFVCKNVVFFTNFTERPSSFKPFSLPFCVHTSLLRSWSCFLFYHLLSKITGSFLNYLFRFRSLFGFQ